MSDPFSRSSGGAQLRGFTGRLALFTPKEFVPNAVRGQYGDVDGIRADVVFLDEGEKEPLAPEDAEIMDSMLIINGPVVKELKPRINDPKRPMHLGRIKEIPNKKGGKNDVVVLDPPTDADVTLARAYLDWLESEDDQDDPFA